jgi:hypothetical protein
MTIDRVAAGSNFVTTPQFPAGSVGKLFTVLPANLATNASVISVCCRPRLPQLIAGDRPRCILKFGKGGPKGGRDALFLACRTVAEGGFAFFLFATEMAGERFARDDLEALDIEFLP